MELPYWQGGLTMIDHHKEVGMLLLGQEGIWMTCDSYDR